MNSLKQNLNILGTSFEVPRKNKGISMIALIIIIIVMIILAGIAIGAYRNVTETQATKTKALNEFIEIENAVFQRGQENKLDASIYPLVGKKLTDENPYPEPINNKIYGLGYYEVTEQDLNELGVSSTTHKYLVNYNNGEVILTEPYVIEGRKIYTKKDLLVEEIGDSVAGSATYDEKKGVNAPIVYSGMLPVIRDGNKWVIVSADDDRWYDYTITSSGPNRMANVMLLDGVTASSNAGQFYSNEELRGMNQEKRVGLRIENEGSMFVWVPRYTFKESNGSQPQSIVYSKLTSDYTLDGYIKAPAFYFGEYTGAVDGNDNAGFSAGGKELTGIWISKYEAKYAN